MEKSSTTDLEIQAEISVQLASIAYILPLLINHFKYSFTCRELCSLFKDPKELREIADKLFSLRCKYEAQLKPLSEKIDQLNVKRREEEKKILSEMKYQPLIMHPNPGGQDSFSAKSGV